MTTFKHLSLAIFLSAGLFGVGACCCPSGDKESEDAFSDQPAGPLMVKVDGESLRSAVKFTIKTEARAKVTVKFQAGYKRDRKSFEESAKTDRKGRAEIIVYNVPDRTKIRATVEAVGEKKTHKERVEFVVRKGPLGFGGTKKKGSDARCALKVRKPVSSLLSADPAAHIPAGAKKLELRFEVPDATSISIQNFGSKPYFFQEKAKFKDGAAKISIPIELYRAQLTMKGATQKLAKAEARVVVVTKGGEEITGSLMCNVPSFADFLAEYQGAPMRLAGESPKRSTHGRTLVLTGGVVTDAVNGSTVQSIRSVDFIAVKKVTYDKIGNCPYRDPNTGKKVNIPKKRDAVELTVHDRRSGKVVGKKSFKGKRRNCPRTLSVKKGSVQSSVSKTKINAYIKSLVAGL